MRYVLGKVRLVEFVRTIALLTYTVEYAAMDKQLRKSGVAGKIVHMLYDNWHTFKEFWSETSSTETNNYNVDRKLALVSLLTKSLLIESFQVNFFLIFNYECP